MKKTLILGLYLGCVAVCAGQQTVTEYDWVKLADTGQSPAGKPASVDGAGHSGCRTRTIRRSRLNC